MCDVYFSLQAISKSTYRSATIKQSDMTTTSAKFSYNIRFLDPDSGADWFPGAKIEQHATIGSLNICMENKNSVIIQREMNHENAYSMLAIRRLFSEK
jgi:hypothetical protein